MNLVGEDDGGPQFFSPARVQAARDHQKSKETEEALRQQSIADKKATAQVRKIEKEQATARRQTQQANARDDKAAEKQITQDAKAAAAQLKKQAVAIKKNQKVLKKDPRQQRPHSLTVILKTSASEPEVVITASSRTRTISRPERYKC